MFNNLSLKENANLCLKEHNSEYNRNTGTPLFVAALFMIVELWKQPRSHITDEWIKNMWYAYTMEFFSHKEK
jgi:nitrate reductase cytochrome c-type subunit